MVVWVENIIIKHLPSTGFSLKSVMSGSGTLYSYDIFPKDIFNWYAIWMIICGLL